MGSLMAGKRDKDWIEGQIIIIMKEEIEDKIVMGVEITFMAEITMIEMGEIILITEKIE